MVTPISIADDRYITNGNSTEYLRDGNIHNIYTWVQYNNELYLWVCQLNK